MVWRFTILPAHCIMCQLSHVRHSAAGRKKKQNGLVVLDCWFWFSFLAYCAMQSYWLTHFILTPLSCVGDEIEWSRLVMNYKAPFKVYYPPSPAPRSLSLSLSLSPVYFSKQVCKRINVLGAGQEMREAGVGQE